MALICGTVQYSVQYSIVQYKVRSYLNAFIIVQGLQ